MYKRLSAIMFPIATLLLLGAVVWGYQENQDKNSILIKAENQYQRAFHDLSFHIDKLHTELGKTLAVNSASQSSQRKGLLNVWRLTSEAQSEINQLPLTLLPFNKTEEFLANIANFSYRTSVRDLAKEPLTKDESKALMTLYTRSKEIARDLRNVQSKVITNNLRWMDVEVAIASENKKMDNTIIDGFKTVDKKVSAYSEVNWGPSMPTVFEKRTYKALSGPSMSAKQIKKKAASFLGIHNPDEITVVENGAGTEYSSYSVTANRPNSRDKVHMDFTKKGGQLVWFMDAREVRNKKLSIDQARDAALKFLDKNQYNDMKAVSYDEYQNVASLVFARVQDDVILLPEKLTVNVALDNGEVIDLQATDYLFEHKERKIKAPVLTLEEARKKLNSNFKIAAHDLALIKNEWDEEVLCYQFIGAINGSDYRMYINADSGIEEMIEEIKQADAEAAAS